MFVSVPVCMCVPVLMCVCVDGKQVGHGILVSPILELDFLGPGSEAGMGREAEEVAALAACSGSELELRGEAGVCACAGAFASVTKRQPAQCNPWAKKLCQLVQIVTSGVPQPHVHV